MRILLRLLSALMDLGVVFVFMIVFIYGAYTVYDVNKIYVDASSVKFETYKPTVEDEKSFEDFARANPDVKGWITVYGTNIDYPLLWTEEFDKYLNLDPEGHFELAGSIFLDHRNKENLSDFKNIIYGHHMEKHQMFGDIDQFRKSDFFNAHEYGDLFYKGERFGIHFFSYFECDAYDDDIYQLPMETKEDRDRFFDHMLSISLYTRNIKVTEDDRLVLLSTCAGTTNGRYILAGLLTRETYPDLFVEEKETRQALVAGKVRSTLEELPFWWPYLLVLLLLMLIVLLTRSIWKYIKTARRA